MPKRDSSTTVMAVPVTLIVALSFCVVLLIVCSAFFVSEVHDPVVDHAPLFPSYLSAARRAAHASAARSVRV